MEQGNLPEIRAKIARAGEMVKEAMDSGLPLLGGEHERELTALWEEFFGDLLYYIKLKSRESGHNLLASIFLTFNRVLFSRQPAPGRRNSTGHKGDRIF